jgi:hypothetical protein
VTAPVIATGGDVTLSAGATLSVTNTTVRAQNTAADASTTGTVTGGGAATGSIVTAGAARTVALRAPGGDASPLPPAPLPPAPLPSVIPRNPGPPPLTLPPNSATTQGDSGGDSNAGLGSLNPQAGGDSSGGSGLTDSAPPAGYEGTADGLGQSAGYSPPPEKSGKGASSGSSGSGSGSQGSNGQGSSASGSGKRQITTVVLPGLVQTQGLPGTNARQDGGSGNGDVSLSADPGGWSQ